MSAAHLEHPAPRRLLHDTAGTKFVSSATGRKYGYLLFLRGKELIAQPFDHRALELTGSPIRVAENASAQFGSIIVNASASASGLLVYVSNLLPPGYQLTWRDRSGKEAGKVGSVQNLRHVALSPDGMIAAVSRSESEIWLDELQRGVEARFVSASSFAPVWSSDGKWIAYASGKSLYIKEASAGSKELRLLESKNLVSPSDWSRDGRYLIYTGNADRNDEGIWYVRDPLSQAGEHKPVRLEGPETAASQGQISPDGRWLAYTLTTSTGNYVYVRAFPSGSRRWRISTGAGWQPRWRGDGKELYFLTPEPEDEKTLIAVRVRATPHGDFEAGSPQPLFHFRAIATVSRINHFLYSITEGGQRFLTIEQAGEAAPVVNVISNWESASVRQE